MDSERILLLCEAHHPCACDYLRQISSKNDVWDKLAAIVCAGKVLHRDVLHLIFTQRPSFLQAQLLQVVKIYADKMKQKPTQNCARNSTDFTVLHDEFLNSNTLWKNSGIPDAVANDMDLFKVCCDTFFDLFIDCNFSRLLYYLMNGFYRKLLAVSSMGLLHYLPPSYATLVEELSVIESVNCNTVRESLAKSLDNELRRLVMEKNSGPSLIAIFCVYPRSFLLLKDSQVFVYFFNRLRFSRSHYR